jgi:tetratricopeptide (TPR) repeat protein
MLTCHEADCYFEARQYREALNHYERAAGLLRDSPSALAAYVQIINCYVFMGDSAEAEAALARARVLTDRLDAEVFEHDFSPETKEDWKEYFAWMERVKIL